MSRGFRLYQWAMTLVVASAALAAAFVVKLEPQVEGDFFFASNDPELRASQEIAQLFPSRDQILIGARGPDLLAPEYLERLRALTEALKQTPGIASVQSLTNGPASPKAALASPLWRRLLTGSEPNLSQLVVGIDGVGGDGVGGDGVGGSTRPELIAAVEKILAEHARQDFALDASGVPFVVEQIRRALKHDLRLFSLISLIAFGLLIALIYRSFFLVAGALGSCLGACVLTLVLLSWFEAPIGVLTANIVTIVFVLTLSHVVFLTANVRAELAALPAEPGAAFARAVSLTFASSFWCMVTTLLGFASLLFASAKPLRELGLAGAVGTLVALAVPFALYPFFLARAKNLGARSDTAASLAPTNWTQALVGRPRRFWLVVVALLALVALPGLKRLDTDPPLPAFFAQDGPIRPGLERIDRNGGSSPLLIVVGAADGGTIDRPAELARLEKAQKDLDADPALGSGLSLTLLLEEARRNAFLAFLPPDKLIGVLESAQASEVARGFVTADRKSALFFLRLREIDRKESRQEVMARLEATVAATGLKVEQVGGLYQLQASLGQLVASSLSRGLGGLLLLFLPIAWIVARQARPALAMIACLIIVPLVLLGGFGWSGAPVDFISSPAGNVAIGMGIDSMIHLVMAARRRLAAGDSAEQAWAAARTRLWPAIVGGAAILAGGFGLFALSSFPPTARFGAAVALGTLLAAAIALLVLPRLAQSRPTQP